MMTSGLVLRPLTPDSEIETDPDALIIVLFMAGDGPLQAEFLTRNWQATVPRAMFLGIELNDMVWHVNLLALQRIVVEAAKAHGLQQEKVVLLGLGDAGGLAIELVMQGVLTALGVIAYDIPILEEHGPLRRGAARIRLVQHHSDADPDNTRFYALIREMQRQNIDVEAVILPEDACLAMRAGSRFLVQLLANTDTPPGVPP